MSADDRDRIENVVRGVVDLGDLFLTKAFGIIPLPEKATKHVRAAEREFLCAVRELLDEAITHVGEHIVLRLVFL